MKKLVLSSLSDTLSSTLCSPTTSWAEFANSHPWVFFLIVVVVLGALTSMVRAIAWSRRPSTFNIEQHFDAGFNPDKVLRAVRRDAAKAENKADT